MYSIIFENMMENEDKLLHNDFNLLFSSSVFLHNTLTSIVLGNSYFDLS